jgi:hypothetical protein
MSEVAFDVIIGVILAFSYIVMAVVLFPDKKDAEVNENKKPYENRNI